VRVNFLKEKGRARQYGKDDRNPRDRIRGHLLPFGGVNAEYQTHHNGYRDGSDGMGTSPDGTGGSAVVNR